MMYIYGLTDPRNDELRYVGVSKQPNERYKEHIKYTWKMQSHVGHWMKNLREHRLKPEMFIIEEVADDAWSEAERFWINYFRAIGARLTNSCDGGGSGPLNPCPETRRKMSVAKKGKPLSPEHRAKLSARLIGNKYTLGYHPTEETRQKISEASRRYHKSIGHNLSSEPKPRLPPRHGGGKKGVKFTEEHKRKISEAIKASYTPELRELRSQQAKGKTHRGTPHTEESKRKISMANKGNKSRTGQHLSSEECQKIRERKLAWWKQKKEKTAGLAQETPTATD